MKLSQIARTHRCGLPGPLRTRPGNRIGAGGAAQASAPAHRRRGEKVKELADA